MTGKFHFDKKKIILLENSKKPEELEIDWKKSLLLEKAKISRKI